MVSLKDAPALRAGAYILLYLIGRKLEAKLALKRLLSSTVLGLAVYQAGASRPFKGTVPAPGYIPWFGHFFEYQKIRDHPAENVLDYSRKRDFKSFCLTMPFGLGQVIVHDEKDRRYILKDNFKNFQKNYNFQVGFNRVFSEVLGSGIFNVDGEEWLTHRKVAAHLFTEKNIGKIFSESFVEHAELMKTALSKFAKEKKSFDIQLLFQSLIFDAFCHIAFSVSPNSFAAAVKGEKEPFQTSFDAVQQLSSYRFFDPPPVRDLKKWLKIGSEAELVKHLRVVDDYILNVIESRKQDISNEDTSEVHKDILGLYIHHAKKSNRPELLETEYLRDMIMNFFIAGRDTTSCVLTNIIALVSENRDFEAKLVEEIQQKLKGGTKNFLQNDIKKFALADAVFNEALRMYPSVSNDLRITYNDDTLPSGIELPGGTIVSIANHSYGRNPKYFKNPNDFSPERWLKQDGDQVLCERIDEYKYPWFWGGYRICLGKDMARQEGKIIMSILLNSFKFSAAKPRKERFSNGPVMFYTDGVYLTAEAR